MKAPAEHAVPLPPGCAGRGGWPQVVAHDAITGRSAVSPNFHRSGHLGSYEQKIRGVLAMIGGGILSRHPQSVVLGKL